MEQERAPESYRVVVAEDNDTIRELLVQQLDELGHLVVGKARDGIEAVRVTAQIRPDVAIIDRGLPLQDGLAAARAIADQAPTAVVLLSAYMSEEDPTAEALMAGAHAFLAKPFLLEELAGALDRAVQRHRHARIHGVPPTSPG